MSEIIRILTNVNETVNVFDLKPLKNFSEPKIYTGGSDIRKWTKYSHEGKIFYKQKMY